MKSEQFDREKRFQAAMYVGRSMYAKRFITWEDLKQIEACFSAKYRPVLGTFLAEEAPSINHIQKGEAYGENNC